MIKIVSECKKEPCPEYDLFNELMSRIKWTTGFSKNVSPDLDTSCCSVASLRNLFHNLQ